MHVVILLAALMGQVSATDGPPRQWLPGVIGGKTVQIWGWRDVSGGVGYRPEENHHLYPQFAPKAAAPVSIGDGVKIEANGTLNSGLDLRASQPTAGLDTNDPDIAGKLGLNSDGPCPSPGPPSRPFVPDQPIPSVSPFAKLEPYAVPIACLLSGLLLVAYAKSKS